MIKPKNNISKIEPFVPKDKHMLEPLVLKGTRAVLRRGQEGNLLTLSDKIE